MTKRDLISVDLVIVGYLSIKCGRANHHGLIYTLKEYHLVLMPAAEDMIGYHLVLMHSAGVEPCCLLL